METVTLNSMRQTTSIRKDICEKVAPGVHLNFRHIACTDSESVREGVRTPLNNHNNIGFLSNTVPDPLTNRTATKPSFNVGSSSAR